MIGHVYLYAVSLLSDSGKKRFAGDEKIREKIAKWFEKALQSESATLLMSAYDAATQNSVCLEYYCIPVFGADYQQNIRNSIIKKLKNFGYTHGNDYTAGGYSILYSGADIPTYHEISSWYWKSQKGHYYFNKDTGEIEFRY